MDPRTGCSTPARTGRSRSGAADHSETHKVEEVGAEDAIPVLRKYIDEIRVTRPYFDATPSSSDAAVAAELSRHPVFRLNADQTDAQLARHGGVAPLEASSGRVRRHRLDRGGNRQLNCALHRIAVTQARIHPAARAYLERKQAEGKSRREEIRSLKRQPARVAFNTLKASPALT
jgi:transposase